MAITFDVETNGGSSTSSFSYSHVCTGSNRALLVGLVTVGAGDNITGVTYNSVAMTGLTRISVPTTNEFVYLFYLLNPASGSNTVSITKTGVADNAFACSVSYAGVNTASIDTTASNSRTTGNNPFPITFTVINNVWIVVMARNSSATTLSAYDSSCVLRGTDGSTGIGIFDSGAFVSVGSATTNLSGANTTPWAALAVSLKTLTVNNSVTLTETVTTTDSSQKAVGKTLTETVTTTDTVLHPTSWKNGSKHTASPSNATKHSASATNATKHSSTATNATKH